MSHAKAALVLDLARRMAASAEGLTVEEIAREYRFSRRSAERLRDAVCDLFPAAEEYADPPHKRWRIRGGLSGSDRGGESGRNSGAGLDEGDLFEEPPLGPARVVLGL